MSKKPITLLSVIRHSSFGILSSFVIRHSSSFNSLCKTRCMVPNAREVGTARCAVRAAFSGASTGPDRLIGQRVPPAARGRERRSAASLPIRDSDPVHGANAWQEWRRRLSMNPRIPSPLARRKRRSTAALQDAGALVTGSPKIRQVLECCRALDLPRGSGSQCMHKKRKEAFHEPQLPNPKDE